MEGMIKKQTTDYNQNWLRMSVKKRQGSLLLHELCLNKAYLKGC